MKRRTIAGKDHWGPYLGRLTHDPNTGRPMLEVLQDDDEVLIKEGSAFVTFWSGQELPRVMPTGPFVPPSFEAIELAVQVAADGDEAALARAVRIIDALRHAGLDPDDRRVRTAVAVTLETIAEEIRDDQGDEDV